MSVERTREVMDRYWDSGHQDLSMMADDVVFTAMATGEEHRGPAAVRQMLDYVYHVAFDAHAETVSRIYSERQAVIEGFLVGKHIGEFAGVPATGRSVRVPLCVVYDLEEARVVRARVYLETPALFKQLGVDAGAAAATR